MESRKINPFNDLELIQTKLRVTAMMTSLFMEEQNPPKGENWFKVSLRFAFFMKFKMPLKVVFIFQVLSKENIGLKKHISNSTWCRL